MICPTCGKEMIGYGKWYNGTLSLTFQKHKCGYCKTVVDAPVEGTYMKTLKDIVEENDDELSFGGYTIDMLECMAKECIKILEKDFSEAFEANDHSPSDKTEYIRGKIDILKQVFNLKDDKHD